MVLSRSDYRVSNLYKGEWDPTSPKSFATKAVGTFVAATAVLYVLAMAQSRGVPLMNRVVGMIPGIGGNLQTDGETQVF